MTYYLKPSRSVIIQTVIGLAILFLLSYISDATNILYLAVYALFLLLLLNFIFRMPICVKITDDLIQVKRLFNSLTFYKKEVDIEPISVKELKKLGKFYGATGLFSYVGWFSLPAESNVRIQTANQNDMALVTTKEGKKYVINYPQVQ